MLRTSTPSLVTRLSEIRDVAHDLTLELGRRPYAPKTAVHEMVAFIKAEAEEALRALASPGSRQRVATHNDDASSSYHAQHNPSD
jgi:hypothetical protein